MTVSKLATLANLVNLAKMAKMAKMVDTRGTRFFAVGNGRGATTCAVAECFQRFSAGSWPGTLRLRAGEQNRVMTMAADLIPTRVSRAIFMVPGKAP